MITLPIWAFVIICVFATPLALAFALLIIGLIAWLIVELVYKIKGDPDYE